MKRKTSKVKPRIWTYGILTPSIENRKILGKIMWDGHIYYNKLVENEREKKKELKPIFKELYNTPKEDKKAAEAELKKRIEEICEREGLSDKDLAWPEAVDQMLKENWDESWKKLQLFHKAMRAFKVNVDLACKMAGYSTNDQGKYGPTVIGKVKPNVIKEMVEDDSYIQEWKDYIVIFEKFSNKKKEIRGNSGVPSATYTFVEKAFEAACKKPQMDSGKKNKDGKFIVKERPFFKKWDGTGKVGISARKLKITDIFNDGKSISIKERGADLLRKGKKKKERKEFTASIGPGKNKIRLAFSYTRELPKDGIITNAWIKVTRIGNRNKYELQLVIESEELQNEFETKLRKKLGDKYIPIEQRPNAAIDVGWRRKEDGDIRVAFLVDDNGNTKELSIPGKMMDGLKFCDKLSSAQDICHDQAIKVTTEWLKKEKQSLPEELQEMASHIHMWKSPKKLTMFTFKYLNFVNMRDEMLEAWQMWRDNRIARKMDLFDDLEAVTRWRNVNKPNIPVMALYLDIWRRKNVHLYNWKEGLVKRIIGHRDHIFKNFVAQIRSEYNVIIFENFDLRGFARNANEDEEKTPDRMHRIRNLASPGRLREIAKQSLGNRYIETEKINTTKKCHLCEFVNDFDNTKELIQTCNSCGESWDQDYNAGKNLLSNHYDVMSGKIKEVSRKTPSRPKKKELELQ